MSRKIHSLKIETSRYKDYVAIQEFINNYPFKSDIEYDYQLILSPRVSPQTSYSKDSRFIRNSSGSWTLKDGVTHANNALKRIQQFQNDRGIISLNHPDAAGMFSLGRSQINLSKLLGED